MKRLTNLLAITLLTSCVTAFAQEQEETTTEKSAVEQSADIYAAGYNKFRFGGYGEILANFMDYGINRFRGTDNGSKKDHRNSISIPRFVLAFDYKFNSQWVLGAEIEFEAGGTGSAYEIENTENGEYEMEVEKGGEVALEQFHITRLIHPAFNVRAGHLIVPVGLTNEHHEPINFFGTSRPEGETTILPSTWHENGIEVFGTFGRGYTRFNYQALVVAGLNANGFDRNTWVAGGKQGLFETDNFTSPGYVARLNYLGVPGLKIGGSFYYCHNTGANSDKPETYVKYGNIPLRIYTAVARLNYLGVPGLKIGGSFYYCHNTGANSDKPETYVKYGNIPLRIYTADLQYKNKYVTARANMIYGNLSKADDLSSVNNHQSGGSPYTQTTPIAKRAVS